MARPPLYARSNFVKLRDEGMLVGRLVFLSSLSLFLFLFDLARISYASWIAIVWPRKGTRRDGGLFKREARESY